MVRGRRVASILGLGLCLLGPQQATAALLACPGSGQVEVERALQRIRASVDPCGESVEVQAMLDRLERCERAAYAVCVDETASRNTFDRPSGAGGVGTITWNPHLQSELEPRCNGDGSRAVLRDPTASLLHELVHAAHDCDGLNPGARELEAVRVENVYRRAAGLCQRTGYGETRLPAEVVRVGTGRQCAVVTHAADHDLASGSQQPASVATDLSDAPPGAPQTSTAASAR